MGIWELEFINLRGRIIDFPVVRLGIAANIVTLLV